MFLKLNYEQVQVYGLLYFFWWLPRKFNLATIKVMDKDGMGGDLSIRESQVFLDPFSTSRQSMARTSMIGRMGESASIRQASSAGMGLAMND
jgi:hypothetical protein